MALMNQYHEQGYATGINVLDPDEVCYYRAQWDLLEKTIGRDKAQIDVLNQHREHAFIWELATHRHILDALEKVMGANIVVLGTHFFCKYPIQIDKAEPFVAWHQDVTYWGLTPPKVTAAWLAIDDVDAQNGPMRVVPGSHKHGIIDHGKSQQAGNLLSINQAVDESQFDPETAVNIELHAGQASLHDGMTVHGSMPNRSNGRRCGLTIRYITPEILVHHEPDRPFHWCPTLVRGKDRHQHNEYLPTPQFT